MECMLENLTFLLLLHRRGLENPVPANSNLCSMYDNKQPLNLMRVYSSL
jgi:hypothetical protein